ncbi:MAG: glutamate formimidoyltransferase [Acidimicrobiales bacterium]
MLECVVNLSEGRSASLLERLTADLSGSLLDVHADPHHHRSVVTLAGPDVEEAARLLTRRAVDLLDLSTHAGAHPRLGVVDVVPFVPITGPSLAGAVSARDRFAHWAAGAMGLPCFLYGPERTLPEVRRLAFRSLPPDVGPPEPHPTAGAVSVGARPPLVAYNLWLARDDVAVARSIAAGLRGPGVRALGLDLGGRAQVSCNLIDPVRTGPAAVYDAVSARAPVARAELVGLIPAAALLQVPRSRWAELDLSEDRTIEARLGARRRA